MHGEFPVAAQRKGKLFQVDIGNFMTYVLTEDECRRFRDNVYAVPIDSGMKSFTVQVRDGTHETIPLAALPDLIVALDRAIG